MALLAYDPTRMTMVPVAQARSIAYVIDSDTGKQYSSVAEAERDIAANRQAALAAFRQGERDSTPAPTQTSTPAQEDVTEKTRVATAQSLAQQTQTKSETTIDPYLQRDPKTGLSPAQVEAQKAVKEAGAVLSDTQKEAATAGVESKLVTPTGEPPRLVPKPPIPPADANFTYDYVWVGASTGKNIGGWKLIKKPVTPTPTPTPTPTSTPTPTPTPTPIPTPTVKESTAPVTTYTAPDGRIFTDLNEYNSYVAKLKQDEKIRQGQSAYNLLFDQFNQYGMGALVEPLKDLIAQGLSQSEFTLRLRETDAYKKRFAANAQRVAKGLRAISEAEYIGLEDAYQETMRNYGLPESYYARGDMGRQEGFEKLIAGGVAPTELEYRIQTAYDKVINAAPEVSQALRQFYPDISNGDILAFVLDPENARDVIRRKVTAAEIGGAALGAGLATDVARAEQLAKYGITGEAARQGYARVAQVLPRGSQLAEFYKQSPYTQQTAEQEVFNLAGGTEAARERKKLAELETASFSGQSGRGALARERAGQF